MENTLLLRIHEKSTKEIYSRRRWAPFMGHGTVHLPPSVNIWQQSQGRHAGGLEIRENSKLLREMNRKGFLFFEK